MSPYLEIVIIERASQPPLVRHVVDYVICLLCPIFDRQIVKKGAIYPRIFIAKFISVLSNFQVWKHEEMIEKIKIL